MGPHGCHVSDSRRCKGLKSCIVRSRAPEMVRLTLIPYYFLTSHLVADLAVVGWSTIVLRSLCMHEHG